MSLHNKSQYKHDNASCGNMQTFMDDNFMKPPYSELV